MLFRYSEALVLLKNSQDAIWHASTLEGLATIQVVDAWAANQTVSLNLNDCRMKLTQPI
jgi:trafficking protein particle complex subunit 9